jgi:hypothetical protein
MPGKQAVSKSGKRPSSKRAEASFNVLFIGNSFTARNDLPGLIAGLATAAGVKFEHQLITAGGASLRMHWNKWVAQKAIKTGRFDYVVLQEQSTLPIKNPGRMLENLRLFDQVIKDGGARTALYMTWARQSAPESQAEITDAYTKAAKELGATLVPVGVGWERFIQKNKEPTLHDADQSHPTLAGSYLAACVMFRTLCERQPPDDFVPAGLSSAHAAMIRDAVSAPSRR